MDLQKLHSDADFDKAIVPEGSVLTYLSTDADGNLVTRVKDSAGAIITLSGSGSGGGETSNIILGMLDENLDFQKLSFTGQEPSNDGSPVAVDEYVSWKGTLPLPEGPGGGGGEAQTDDTVLLAHFDDNMQFSGSAEHYGVATEQVSASDYEMSSPSKWSPVFDTGKFGSALLFPQPEGSEDEWDWNRYNHRVILPVGSTIFNSDFTIEFWYYTIEGYDNNGVIMSATEDKLLHFAARGGHGDSTQQVVDIRIGDGNSWILYSTPTVRPTKQTWHHVAFVRSENMLTVYIDGQQVEQADCTTLSTAGTGLFTLGTLTSIFEGKVDELRISTVARYTESFTPQTSPFEVEPGGSNPGQPQQYMDLYKCTSVEGPQILNFVSVTDAGISDCNGNYSDTGMLKNDQPVYGYTSTSGTTWYIYYTTSDWDGDSWVLSDHMNVAEAYGSHYYGSQLSGTWWGGEGAGEDAGQATVSIEYSVINTGQAKTWSGYKLVATETGYEISEDITTGLVYGVGAESDYVNNCITPKVGGVYNSDCTAEICDIQFVTDNALTFTAEEPFSTVMLNIINNNTDLSGVKYSTDGVTWLSYTKGLLITLSKVGDYVKFWNTKSTLSINDGYTEARFSLTGKIAASGELKSMLNYLEDWPNHCFNYLFRNQDALTSCPYVSCNKLGTDSLHYTFNGCKNIKKVKIRINELLPRDDGGSMQGIDGVFGGCSSLEVIEADLNSWIAFDTYNGWVNGVAQKGVFIKPAALPEEYGVCRIPNGWTVINK